MTDASIHTRREFLSRGLTLASAGVTVPLFLDRTAWAIADPFDVKRVSSAPGVPDERVLVVLQLAGGNDGLNTVIPFRNDRYHAARPQLAVGKDDVLTLNDDVGLHPAAEGLKRLYDDGLLGIVQGVGYPNPNRSHFVSTDIWATADLNHRRHHGWIGRYFDCTCKGSDRPDPRGGIAITPETPLAMTGERFRPVSFSSPAELSWRSPGADGVVNETFDKLNVPAAGVDDPPPGAPRNSAAALSYLQRVAMDAMADAEDIQRAAGITIARRRGRRGRRRVAADRGSSPLARQLGMVRRMIAAGLDTRVYYVSQGGFDTHAGQAGRHRNLLRQLGDALASFVGGLKTDGLLDKVILLTFSEFGRRVAQNASGGTDHGTAAPMFLVGSRIRPGIHADHPSLEPDHLDRGDLKWTTDFRSVYAAILTDWLAADAERILGGGFGRRLKLLR